MDGHVSERVIEPIEPEAAPEGMPAVLDALLRRPSALLTERAGQPRGTVIAIAVACVAASGALMASWSGGVQLALVPVKLVLCATAAAIVCLPSLYVLSALSGGEPTLRQAGTALSMGMALAGVIAVALAPIAWVLSAATDQLALAGVLHLLVFFVAAGFGLRLVRRAMAGSTGTSVRGLGAWSVLFVIVALQLATTLRPLVGPFDGVFVHERAFFLSHLLESLS
jgi:hypothetical protein